MVHKRWRDLLQVLEELLLGSLVEVITERVCVLEHLPTLQQRKHRTIKMSKANNNTKTHLDDLFNGRLQELHIDPRAGLARDLLGLRIDTMVSKFIIRRHECTCSAVMRLSASRRCRSANFLLCTHNNQSQSTTKMVH